MENSHPRPPPNSLPPSALERYFAEHEFSTPFLACCSDVEPLTVSELLEITGEGGGGGEGGGEGGGGGGEEAAGTAAAAAATGSPSSFLGRVSLGYLDPRGSLKLREAVAREHNDDNSDRNNGGGKEEKLISADDVLVAAPQELAYLLQRAVLQGKERGEEGREREGEREREFSIISPSLYPSNERGGEREREREEEARLTVIVSHFKQ